MIRNSIDYRNFVHCFSLVKAAEMDEFKKIYIFNPVGDKRIYMCCTNGHTALIYRLNAMLNDGEPDIFCAYSYTEKMTFFAKQNKNKSIFINEDRDLLFLDESIIKACDLKKEPHLERAGWENILAQVKAVCVADELKPSRVMSFGMTAKMYEHIFAGCEKGEIICTYADANRPSAPQVIRIPSCNNFIGVVMPMSHNHVHEEDNVTFFKDFWNY